MYAVQYYIKIKRSYADYMPYVSTVEQEIFCTESPI